MTLIDEMIVHRREGRLEAALLSNGRLIEMRVVEAAASAEQGAIHLGRVETLASGLEAAFVDIGGARAGFLRFADAIGGERDRPRPGDPVLVQVMRPAGDDKGPRLSMKLALPGRFVVLRPQETGTEISGRIEDPAERQRIADELRPLAAEFGLTARTAAADRDGDALRQEVQRLATVWERVRAQALTARPPLCLLEADDALVEAMREFGGYLQRIIADDKSVLRRLNGLVALGGDRCTVEHHTGDPPIFDIHDIAAQLGQALAADVALPSGGSISIEPTRALTAIDVDSGGAHPLTANLEAAEEVARQLRLRNIGGIVIVDFITLRNANERDRVLGRLATALAADPVPSQTIGWTRLGLVEITRARRGRPLAEAFAAERP